MVLLLSAFNIVLLEVGTILGKDVGRFVKFFIVPLHIFLCDTNKSVKELCNDVFLVCAVFFSHG